MKKLTPHQFVEFARIMGGSKFAADALLLSAMPMFSDIRDDALFSATALKVCDRNAKAHFAYLEVSEWATRKLKAGCV